MYLKFLLTLLFLPWIAEASTDNRRFLEDGDNPCARILLGPNLLPTPTYYRQGKLEPGEAEREVNRRFLPFSWGGPPPTWLVTAHQETLQDISQIMTEVLDGTAFKVMFRPKPADSDNRLQLAIKLREEVRQLNAATASDEQMLGLMEKFYLIVNGGSSTTDDLQKEFSSVRAFIQENGLPRPHFFFTLRPLDNLDVVGLPASGVFPIGATTTRKVIFGGSAYGSGTDYTRHDISHAHLHLGSLIEVIHDTGLDPIQLLRFEYESLRLLAIEALNGESAVARLVAVGTLYKFSHEFDRFILVQDAEEFGNKSLEERLLEARDYYADSYNTHTHQMINDIYPLSSEALKQKSSWHVADQIMNHAQIFLKEAQKAHR